MFALLLGAVVLLLLLGGMRAFERASIGSVRTLLVWIAALAGLSLALLLVLTGRAGAALGALVFLAPMLWQRVQTPPRRPDGHSQSPSSGGRMTRQEAYEVLGLRPGASRADIQDAHRRLMRGAHPDAGGSDWLAARINQARDRLLN